MVSPEFRTAVSAFSLGIRSFREGVARRQRKFGVHGPVNSRGNVVFDKDLESWAPLDKENTVMGFVNMADDR